jgi:hypothetical protein
MRGIMAIVFGEEIVQSRKAGMPNASLLLYIKNQLAQVSQIA